MDKETRSDARKSGWRGGGGIGSGFTGGDHLACNALVPLACFMFGAAFTRALVCDPAAVLVAFAPVVVLGTAAYLLRRRNKPAFLILWVLAVIAGVFSLAALWTPDSRM